MQQKEELKAKLIDIRNRKRLVKEEKLLEELKAKLLHLQEREHLIRDRRNAIGISKRGEICIEKSFQKCLHGNLDWNYTKIHRKLLETIEFESMQKIEEEFLELIEKSVLNDYTLSVLDKEYLIRKPDLRLKIAEIISLPFQRKKPDLSIFFK